MGSEPQGGACVSRGGLSCPWISPGGSERTGTGDTGHAGTRCRPPPPPGGAARGAARGEPKPLRGGERGVPFLRPPIPWERAPLASSAAAGAGREWDGSGSGNGKAGLFLRPSGERGSGICAGKAAEPAGTVAPPRGDAEPSLTSGAGGSGEGRCQGLSWDRRRSGRARRNGRSPCSPGEQRCASGRSGKPLAGVSKGRPAQAEAQRPGPEEAGRQSSAELEKYLQSGSLV